MQKLYDHHLKTTESVAPVAPAAVTEEQDQPKRKANFFERKRFVEYEQEVKEQQMAPEVVVEETVTVVHQAKPEPVAVKSSAPPPKVEKPQDVVMAVTEKVQDKKEVKHEVSDKDDYAYDWKFSDHDFQDKSDQKPA